MGVKILLFALIFLSFSSFAASDCTDYEFVGTVRLHDQAFFVHIHEGTLSEIQIQIPKSEELKFLPYHQELMRGKFEEGIFTDLEFAVPGSKERLQKKEDCR
jgi:hypothetical protein